MFTFFREPFKFFSHIWKPFCFYSSLHYFVALQATTLLNEFMGKMWTFTNVKINDKSKFHKLNLYWTHHSHSASVFGSRLYNVNHDDTPRPSRSDSTEGPAGWRLKTIITLPATVLLANQKKNTQCRFSFASLSPPVALEESATVVPSGKNLHIQVASVTRPISNTDRGGETADSRSKKRWHFDPAVYSPLLGAKKSVWKRLGLMNSKEGKQMRW